MKLVFDLDGTICEERSVFERSLAKPIEGALEFVNKAYDCGEHIIIFTARGWAEYNMTYAWLKENGFKFHQLICGKPIADILYDDRAQIPNYIKNKI